MICIRSLVKLVQSGWSSSLPALSCEGLVTFLRRVAVAEVRPVLERRERSNLGSIAAPSWPFSFPSLERPVLAPGSATRLKPRPKMSTEPNTFQEPNTKNQAPRTKNQEPRTKNQEPRTKHQAPRTKHQEPSTRHFLHSQFFIPHRAVRGHVITIE